MMTREEFTFYWGELGRDDSPLWNYERHVGKKCNWFVKITPTKFDNDIHHEWCNKNLKGVIMCYSSSDDCEWWGFTHKDDVAVWLLRWA